MVGGASTTDQLMVPAVTPAAAATGVTGPGTSAPPGGVIDTDRLVMSPSASANANVPLTVVVAPTAISVGAMVSAETVGASALSVGGGGRWLAYLPGPEQATLAGLSALPSEVPVDPSAPEARQWLSDELAKADYQDTRSLLERFFSWLQSLLNRATPTSSNPEGYTVPQWLIAALVVLLIAALALLASRVRAERRAAQDSMGPVLGGLDLTSAQFRARGEQALAERRWSDAVLEFTRALARGARARPDAPATQRGRARARPLGSDRAWGDDYRCAARREAAYAVGSW